MTFQVECLLPQERQFSPKLLCFTGVFPHRNRPQAEVHPYRC